jgi:hypothetical protein
MSRFQAATAAVLAMVLGVGGGTAPASASRGPEPAERLAIYRLDFSGNVAPPLRDGLSARLREGLTTVGFEVLRSGEGGPTGKDARCAEPDCLRDLATRLSARYLVGARVTENAKTFDIALELYNGRTGAVVGTSRERCEICGAEEVGEKMSLAAAALRSRLLVLATAPVRFVVRTRPHGAAISIDDKPAGRTPIDVSLVAGPHRMSIEHEGFSPLQRSFTVVSGVDESLDLDLVRLPSPFPFRMAGWTAMVTGTLLAAGGVYLLRLDGSDVRCSADAMDGDGDCPRVYQTKLAGAGLLGLSAVSATLGGVWLFLAPPSDAGAQGPEQRLGFRFGATGRF